MVVNDLRKNVFSSVLRQDMAFFDRNKVGEIVSRLSTDALIVGYSVSVNLSDGVRALVTCLGSGALMVFFVQYFTINRVNAFRFILQQHFAKLLFLLFQLL